MGNYYPHFIKVSGNTFPIKDDLISWGLHYHHEEKCWYSDADFEDEWINWHNNEYKDKGVKFERVTTAPDAGEGE